LIFILPNHTYFNHYVHYYTAQSEKHSQWRSACTCQLSTAQNRGCCTSRDMVIPAALDHSKDKTSLKLERYDGVV